MIAIVIGLAVVLGAVSIWGWYAMPELLSREHDEESYEQRGAEMRRGVLAYAFAALLIGVLLAASCGHW